MPKLRIGSRWVGDDAPVYFIADIAANHDGQLDRAVALIHAAAEAGADAAKFQHFVAPKIVSRHGFEALGSKQSHQAHWGKSVYEVYQDASVPAKWTETLKLACEDTGIDFLTSPYDMDSAVLLAAHLPAFKVGSGEITWIEELEWIARQGKPVLLATGASDLGDVQRAVTAIQAINPELLLMQCNTNYTGSSDNFRHVQLKVLCTYAALYPNLVLGLSDHTPGHATVLGGVALGARAIEKHFTDDSSRRGPDHAFSMNPLAWHEMVQRTRELELALGDGLKRVEPNEAETVVLQRRCLRASCDLPLGQVLTRSDLEPLRPAPAEGIFPYDLDKVLGRTLRRGLRHGEHLLWADLS